jgi:DNA-binding transcriptional ArsR family regulator
MFLLQGSKLRKKLLTHLFHHADEQYYVRELAALLVEDAGNMSNELAKLYKEGLLSFKTKGNTKLYSLDKKYPLHNELKKLIHKSAGAEGGLKRLAGAHPGISSAAGG